MPERDSQIGNLYLDFVFEDLICCNTIGSPIGSLCSLQGEQGLGLNLYEMLGLM